MDQYNLQARFARVKQPAKAKAQQTKQQFQKDTVQKVNTTKTVPAGRQSGGDDPYNLQARFAKAKAPATPAPPAPQGTAHITPTALTHGERQQVREYNDSKRKTPTALTYQERQLTRAATMTPAERKRLEIEQQWYNAKDAVKTAQAEVDRVQKEADDQTTWVPQRDRAGGVWDTLDNAKKALQKAESDLAYWSLARYEDRSQRTQRALSENPVAAGQYADAKKVIADQQKLYELIGYRQQGGGGDPEDAARFAQMEEELVRDYGLAPDAVSAYVGGYGTPYSEGFSVQQIMERMDSALAERKTALKEGSDRAAGYDFDDLYGYEQRVEALKRRDDIIANTREVADEHPVWSSVGTVPLQFLRPVDIFTISPGRGDPGDPDYIPPYNRAGVGDMIDTTRGTVAEGIKNKVGDNFWGNTLSFLYSTGMSTVDSAAAVAVMGPSSVYLMGTNAGIGNARDIIDRGGTIDQAIAGGVAAGAAEIIFEKFSVENLLKPRTVSGWRSWVKETLKQGGVEASEEMATEIANILSDAAIMGEKSNFNQAVRAYQDQGMSEEEAKRKAYLDLVGQVALAGAGGFVSGSLMGGSVQGYNLHQYNQQSKLSAETAHELNLPKSDPLLTVMAQSRALAKPGQTEYNVHTPTTTEGGTQHGEQGAQLDGVAEPDVGQRQGLRDAGIWDAGGRTPGQGDLPASGELRLTEDKAGYSRLLDEARAADPVHGWAVTPKTAEELADCRVFLTGDGGVGLAVAPDGDIEAVFRNRDRHPQGGAMKSAIPHAISVGGSKLDCYGSGLVNVYSMAGGFVPVARVKFDPEFANPGWTADKGTPDIYVMMATDLDADAVRSKQGSYKFWTDEELSALPLMEYDEAMRYRDELLAKRNAPSQSAGAALPTEIGVDTPSAQTGENGAPVAQDVSPMLKPALEATAKKRGEPSSQATSVMDRLAKGEEVSLDEIYQIPEIAEVRKRPGNPTAEINTPERVQLRQEVFAQLFAKGSQTGLEKGGDGGYNGPIKRERRADIVIGVPAAGKSSVLVDPLSLKHGSRVIDSDMAKELLPEYDGGKGAGDVHKESSMIRDRLLAKATERGENIVWPQVGGKLEDLYADILDLKAKGYEVHLHLNELSAWKATGRAIGRFFSNGRYIDPGLVLKVGDAPTRNYEVLRKEGGLLDGYSRYSNDVPFGAKPIRIEDSGDIGPSVAGGSEGRGGGLRGDGTGLRSGGQAGGPTNGPVWGADPGGLRGGRPDGVGSVEEGTGAAGGQGRQESAGDTGAGVGAAERGFAGAYDRLQGETPASGFHPDGEDAYRQVDVPMRDFDGRAIPKSAATVMEARATPDSAVETIQKMIADGALSFDSITDKAALSRAEKSIQEAGYKEALGAWLEKAGRGSTSKDLVVEGQLLLNNAMNSRATGDVVQILSAYTRMSTTAAQALQAQRVLKKMSPEWQLFAVQKSLATYQKELNARLGDDAPTVKVDQDLYDAYVAAADDAGREAALMDIYQAVADQLPASFAEKWNAWRYLSMLGNPRTHIRNIAGNAGFAPVRGVKNALAWGIEHAVDTASKAFGGDGIERTKSVILPLVSRLSAQDGPLVRACYQDIANVEDQLLGAGKWSTTPEGQIEQRKTIFKTKPLEAARKFNGKALDVEDTWFSRPVYAGALAGYLKAHKVTAQMLTEGTVKTDVLDAARAYAIKEAQKATYRDANAFSDLVAKFGYKGKNKVGKALNVMAEGVLPFKRTPANILVRGVEYSPAGLVKGLGEAVWSVPRGTKTAAQAIDSVAAGLTGTGLLALGAWLAAMGLVTGGGGSDPEDKHRDLTGGQNYALTLPGGTSVTLDWLAPEAMPFFMGVEAYNYAQDHTDGAIDLKAIENAVIQVTDPLMETSMLQGLQDAVNEVKFADAGTLLRVAANAGMSYLTQGLPTLFGQIERTAESERQSTYVDRDGGVPKEVQWLLGKAMNKLPGEYNQIPYIDAWGRREETGTPLERAVNNLLNPAYVSKENKTEADMEIERLMEAGQTGVVPQRPAQSVQICKEYLSAEEYVAYAEAKGQLSYQLVSEMIASKVYKAMSDADKAKAISDAYGYANAVAKKQVKPQYEMPSEYTKTERMLDAGLSFGQWAAMRSGMDADGSGRTSNEELELYVNAHFPQAKREKIIRAYKGQ